VEFCSAPIITSALLRKTAIERSALKSFDWRIIKKGMVVSAQGLIVRDQRGAVQHRCAACRLEKRRELEIFLACTQIAGCIRERISANIHCSLRGPGIEIFVGSSAIPSDSLETSAGSPDTLSGSSETPSDSPAASYHMSETWTLPVALISHFSPILRAACTRDFKERQERLIKLPEDNPDAFALFVEWLYYGDYSISPALSLTKTPHSINIDLQCWVLGDKLLCTDFKNYAMRRIYQRYTRVVFGLGVMTTYEVDYVCANTAAGSNLMKFFCAFVGEHFAVERRLEGTVEMWDQLILEHADLRRFLLERFRMGIVGERGVKAEEEYMDVELDEADALPSDVAKLNVEAGD
jgi:hypothetical protein